MLVVRISLDVSGIFKEDVRQSLVHAFARTEGTVAYLRTPPQYPTPHTLAAGIESATSGPPQFSIYIRVKKHKNAFLCSFLALRVDASEYRLTLPVLHKVACFKEPRLRNAIEEWVYDFVNEDGGVKWLQECHEQKERSARKDPFDNPDDEEDDEGLTDGENVSGSDV
jgi:hypothetical protein